MPIKLPQIQINLLGSFDNIQELQDEFAACEATLRWDDGYIFLGIFETLRDAVDSAENYLIEHGDTNYIHFNKGA